jgi:hypothetical protein
MNDELKTILSAFIYCLEHRLCDEKMEGISEYSDSYKAGLTEYISGVNDMARELIREAVKAVDDEQ